MNATSSKIPATFEAFMAERDIPADHENLDGWRRVWQNELEVEASAPTVIPPCPSWCTLPSGHGYTDYDIGADLPMTHERGHVGFTSAHVQVSSTESNQDGRVTVGVPTAFVNVEDDLKAAALRAFAADLLEAADVLDRITR